MRQLIAVLVFTFLVQEGAGVGCLPPICKGQALNETPRCADPQGQNCHETFYGGFRNGRAVYAVDVFCDVDVEIAAPFDGTISFQAPFGDGSCADKGLRIEGEGAWQGYAAVISFVDPYRYSGRVTTTSEHSTAIGKTLSVRCANSPIREDNMAHYVRFALEYEGRPINATSYLMDCHCTGQICETNPHNTLVDPPFKAESAFGKGFEINCPDLQLADQNAASGGVAPKIRAPISGGSMGRIRLRKPTATDDDCTNDGVFIVGDGKWEHYTARIYNVKFLTYPYPPRINQGDEIARRLDCPGVKVSSVFMEIRYHGRLVNMTDQISGQDCSLGKGVLPILPANWVSRQGGS